VTDARTDIKAAPAAASGIPGDVWAISTTSLFSDWSYEMILPVLPFFLVLVLHATPAVVGLVEGLALFVQSWVQFLLGGRVAARANRRESGAVGYGTTTVANGLLALASAWPVVASLRALAWAGRGERQPIKKAIVADAARGGRVGRAFGLEQAFDSQGAILGTVVAIGFVVSSGVGAFRSIFAVSVIPGLIAVLIFSVFVKDRNRRILAKSAPAAAAAPARGPSFPAAFRRFLLASGLFGFAFFNILLALLSVGERLLGTPGTGVTAAIAFSLVVYLVYNLVGTGFAYPSGLFADRFSGLPLVALSYVLFAPVDLLLIYGGGAAGAVAVFVLAGFQVALLDVAEGTWIGRTLPSALAGRGYGWFGGIRGTTTLVGSVVVGYLWTAISPNAGFLLSAIVSVASAVLLMAWVPERARRPGPAATASKTQAG
jgi:MFS family permease